MSDGPERLRYPPSALTGDMWRSGLGGLATALLLVFGAPALIPAAIIGILLLLFLLYGARTLIRKRSAYVLTEDGLVLHGPFSSALPWSGLRALKLRYYTTRPRREAREPGAGWMELKLKGPQGTMRIESSLDGFERIVDAAFEAARESGLRLDETSHFNYRALTGDFPSDGAPRYREVVTPRTPDF